VRGKLVLLVGWCGRVAALAIATAVLAVANPSSEGRAAAFHALGHSGQRARDADSGITQARTCLRICTIRAPSTLALQSATRMAEPMIELAPERLRRRAVDTSGFVAERAPKREALKM
jgi:hypothetical protein